MNDKIDMLGKKFAVLQKKMDGQKQNSCKEADEVMYSAKSEIKRIYDDVQVKSDKEKQLFYIKLINAQKTFDKRKEHIKIEIDKSKSQNIKNHEKAEVEFATEYATFAIDRAMISIEEATLSFYDAVEKAEKYIKKYGDE